MRKKIFTFLLALVTSLGCMWAQNPSGTCGTDLTWEFNPATGALTISGTGTTMTSIGWVSGVWNEQVTSVTFPESLTSIEVMSAFQGFGMSTITLPENLTVLGYAAFYQCGALTSIEIPAGVSTIQGSTFSQCSSLATVKLPASITSIDDYAFADCPALTYFYSYAETPPTCESNKVFWDMQEWKPLDLSADTLYVPYSSIADYKAANGWNSFGTIAAIPGTEPASTTPTVYNSGSVALSNLKVGDILMAGVTLTTEDNSNLIKFAANRVAFNGNKYETDISFLFSQITPLLGENATISFGSGDPVPVIPINEVGDAGNAWEVTEVNTGDTPVTLTGITYSGTTPATSGSCGDNLTWEFNPSTGALTISGTGAMTSAPWETYYKEDITSLSLPDGLTAIPSEAFKGCTGLTTVTIPASVTSIGADAFVGCTSVTDVYCYPKAADLDWDDYYTDDFIYEPMETRCHVFADEYLEYIARYSQGDGVNVTFMNDLEAVAVTTNEDPKNPAVYYSTFYHGTQKYRLPNDGTEAYVADLSGSDLRLTKIAEGNDVLPNGVAVILKAPGTNVTLFPTEAEPVTFTAHNSMQGVDAETTAPANCYVLSGTNEYGVGFYRINSENLKAHKAFVQYTGNQNNAPKRMRFVFNQTTDVESIQPSAVSNQKILENGQVIIIRNGVKYNVSGQIVR